MNYISMFVQFVEQLTAFDIVICLLVIIVITEIAASGVSDEL